MSTTQATTERSSTTIFSSSEEVVECHKLQYSKFPWKLHRLLDEAEAKGYEEVISWMPGGKTFKVHSKQRFSEDVMPQYFDSTKVRSFQRSLNLWGFQTVQKGADKGQCIHRFFVRGHPDLCLHMQRTKIKGNDMKKKMQMLQEQATINHYESRRPTPYVEHSFASTSLLPRGQMIDRLRSAACGSHIFELPTLAASKLAFLASEAQQQQLLLLQALRIQKQRELAFGIIPR
jgi:hypothetical protein